VVFGLFFALTLVCIARGIGLAVREAVAEHAGSKLSPPGAGDRLLSQV
jgi:hypothetical protein